MGRNNRKRKPLGYDVGFCWDDSMAIDPSTAAGEAVRYVAEHGNVGARPMRMRAMVKFEEIEKNPARHKAAMARIERAQSYGCPIQLCIDCFNSADARNTYHKYQYLPTPAKAARIVRDLVREIEPDQVEVFNEYWYTKGAADMRAKEYAKWVDVFVEGFSQANWNGLLVASNELDKPQDKVEDLWVWNVEWDTCAESEHTLILMKNGPADHRELAIELDKSTWLHNGGTSAIGWIWPIHTNETSFTNQAADNNTPEGARMARTTLEFYRRHKTPLVLLTMSGTYDDAVGPGDWGMRSWFVDRYGNLSLAAREMLKVAGADPNPVIEPEEPDEPIEPEEPEEPDKPIDPEEPGGKGHGKVVEARERLRLADMRWYRPGGPRNARRALRLINEALERRKA